MPCHPSAAPTQRFPVRYPGGKRFPSRSQSRRLDSDALAPMRENAQSVFGLVQKKKYERINVCPLQRRPPSQTGVNTAAFSIDPEFNEL